MADMLDTGCSKEPRKRKLKHSVEDVEMLHSCDSKRKKEKKKSKRSKCEKECADVLTADDNMLENGVSEERKERKSKKKSKTEQEINTKSDGEIANGNVLKLEETAAEKAARKAARKLKKEEKKKAAVKAAKKAARKLKKEAKIKAAVKEAKRAKRAAKKAERALKSVTTNVEETPEKGVDAAQVDCDKPRKSEAPVAAPPSGIVQSQWTTASLGDSQRQSKFLRLLGGFKQENSGSVSSAVATQPVWNSALDKAGETKLNTCLEDQFTKALDLKSHRGIGLGFAPPEPPKKNHIDIHRVKSKRFA